MKRRIFQFISVLLIIAAVGKSAEPLLVEGQIPVEQIGHHKSELLRARQVQRSPAPKRLIPFPVSDGLPLASTLQRYSQATREQRDRQELPGHYMVYFNSGLFPYTAIKSPGEETLITAGGQSLGLKAAELIGSAGALTHEFTNGNGGFAAFLTTDELKRIMAHPEVASVNATSRARRSSLWGHDRINQRVAPLDSNSTVAGVSNGAGVHIYIIDSGIRGTHTAFTGRLSAGYSPPLVSANPYIDVDGHGTHVTGIAGGTTYGVATGATLHAVSIVDSSGNWAFEPEVINALNWVKNNHVAPAVVNCSWSIGYSTNVEAAVYDLLNSGAKVVFAAGNFAAATTDFPAAIGEVIAVGASEINISGNDEKAVFTNYGNKVDVYAPGTQILSADIANDTASRDDSGTSMATPFVTGTIALYLQTAASSG